MELNEEIEETKQPNLLVNNEEAEMFRDVAVQFNDGEEEPRKKLTFGLKDNPPAHIMTIYAIQVQCFNI